MRGFSDPVLASTYEDLARSSVEKHRKSQWETAAAHISSLTQAMRARLGPPWKNDPSVVDAVAEDFSLAVAHMQGIESSETVRTHATTILQRMINLLQEKNGPANTPWIMRMEALRRFGTSAQIIAP